MKESLKLAHCQLFGLCSGSAGEIVHLTIESTKLGNGLAKVSEVAIGRRLRQQTVLPLPRWGKSLWEKDVSESHQNRSMRTLPVAHPSGA